MTLPNVLKDKFTSFQCQLIIKTVALTSSSLSMLHHHIKLIVYNKVIPLHAISSLFSPPAPSFEAYHSRHFYDYCYLFTAPSSSLLEWSVAAGNHLTTRSLSPQRLKPSETECITSAFGQHLSRVIDSEKAVGSWTAAPDADVPSISSEARIDFRSDLRSHLYTADPSLET